MKAMVLRGAGRVSDESPLVASEIDEPVCGDDDLVVRVRVCGVCRTDLDLAEGRLVPPAYPVVPGHQIVGVVERVGANVTDRRVGERIGVAWIRWACGECRWCLAGTENLCPRFQATGCDANGGYAELVAVPAAFTYPLPDALDDVHAAPLLCAGAIGWRSLRLAELVDGDPVGLTGFGASAHLVLQVARRRYPRSPIFVFARNAGERAFATELGASWTGDTNDDPPGDLAAIIDTTPAWAPVVSALRRLMPGGRLVINAIRKSDADRDVLASIRYETDLWMERELRSVANVTRADVNEMLAFAAEAQLRPTVEELPLNAANSALAKLAKGGGLRGATALRVSAA